ncbi:Asp-tRNA(Asn)/Glu-tRNA(Gln) amidotransferase subunit GatA [Candidatus Dojkabacteria bacterium]|nr:Asp-tRNA(Asn)/Glu-tRNA(Gln) amidotransferase subunit GatA [Candidatus Dojkabacteria bacterium]
MLQIDNLTIHEIHDKLQRDEFSATALVKDSLERIEKLDPKIRAFITITEDEALDEARRVDSKIAKKIELKTLEGIPYSAKDVFCTKGIRTTAGSKILENFVPPYDATVIKRMKEAGAILVGKVNCDPFGFGSSTENSGFFTTLNPYDLKRVPGGSSGGSAAAVACGMGLFSIAEDTGGSIRQPSSFCNVSGIKVTYGRVSRFGSIAYGSSLDTVGHIGRSVEDIALILEETAGVDTNDATTVPVDVSSYTERMKESIGSIQIGIPKEYFPKGGIDKEVEATVREAAKTFDEMGCHIEEISLPHTEYAIAAYYLTAISEVSANLSRYDGIRFGYRTKEAKDLKGLYEKTRAEGFEDEVKRRIMLGTYALSAGYYDAYYKKAMQVRTILKREFEEAFKRVDVILAPVAPTPAFKVGEHLNDPLAMWLEDAFTVTLNPTGCPGLAIPAGFSKSGLPIGMQIIGPQFSEDLLFRLGYHFQNATDYHEQRPEIVKQISSS